MALRARRSPKVHAARGQGARDRLSRRAGFCTYRGRVEHLFVLNEEMVKPVRAK